MMRIAPLSIQACGVKGPLLGESAMQALSGRQTWLALVALAVGMFLAQGVMAHHGWGWASD